MSRRASFKTFCRKTVSFPETIQCSGSLKIFSECPKTFMSRKIILQTLLSLLRMCFFCSGPSETLNFDCSLLGLHSSLGHDCSEATSLVNSGKI